jgi:NADPH:quinone reductase-like Zn-dependent oxidoreductase
MRPVAISQYGAKPAVTQLPDPEAGADDLLIKIQAAGVNPMDRSIASGASQAQVPATFPMIIGSDLADVVEAVGASA